MRQLVIFISATLCLLFGTAFSVTVAEGTSELPAPKLVILKLDDVVTGGDRQPRWQRVADFLEQKKIKSAMGIIGYSLVNDDPAYFKWITDRAIPEQVIDKNTIDPEKPRYVEFWNHGFYQRRSNDDFAEFEGTFEEQVHALSQTDKLATEKLGLTLTAWGPHWCGTNANTDRALAEVPNIRLAFGHPARAEHFKGFLFKNRIDIEYPTHNTDFETFKKNYLEKKDNFDYFFLQGHPNSWDDKRWENFVKIIEYLETENVRFVTPIELLEHIDSQNR